MMFFLVSWEKHNVWYFLKIFVLITKFFCQYAWKLESKIELFEN